MGMKPRLPESVPQVKNADTPPTKWQSDDVAPPQVQNAGTPPARKQSDHPIPGTIKGGRK